MVSPRSIRLGILAIAGAAAMSMAAACSESAPPPPPPPPAPVVKTAQERAAMYQACWQQFNDKAWDKFQNCYTETATSESVDSNPPSVTGRAQIVERAKTESLGFPDRRGEVKMILINGDHATSVALWTGTNTGALPPGPDGKPVPATNKPVGFLMAHTLDYDSTGAYAVRDAAYIDEHTLMSQLGLDPSPARKVEKATGAPAMVVIAKNDAAETANVNATRSLFDALNKHDIKGIEALTGDDYKGVTIAEAKDVNKKESLAGTKEMFGAFPDVAITPATVWGAGDFVVVTGTFQGTNTGPMPSAKMPATGNKVSARFLEILRFGADGKVHEDWLFYNGAAMMAQLTAKK